MRLINLDEIGIKELDPENYENKDYVDGWNAAVSVIKTMPEVKIQPKRGVWLHMEPNERKEGRMTYERRCSVCGWATYFTSEIDSDRYYDLHRYCTHCGAKLDSVIDMRLIDADAATEKCKEPTIYDLEDVPDFLKECPTIDAKPVRLGHWIEEKTMTGG